MDQTINYKETLNLLKTDFPMRANLVQREPEFLKRWEEAGMYQQIQAATAGRPTYILHDGPPYANGHIHLGTAFNKILKDIILKAKRMSGYHCPYVPGWDCHGLPIEHNVDKELGARKREISILEVRDACRRYAEKWIDVQREEFKRLGVLGDWEHPYLTINFAYEAAIAREFNTFLLSGGVVKSLKPVYWCTSCQTALAEAEVEYHNHASPSIYVKFPVQADLGDRVPELAADRLGGRPLSVLIWTTTPWTLPANLAVAFHPDYTYVAVAVAGDVWIMAADLVESVLAGIGPDAAAGHEIIASFSAVRLEGASCRHPFMDRDSLMILADYVTLETGTGVVHTAPGHGREDYLSGLNYKLDILSPVDNQGRFTGEAGPYAGMYILDANRRINDDLEQQGLLVREASISHSYPHCWRCKKPVIFRATEQWFIGMEANGLREKALKAIKTVSWTPAWGMERIYGMVESRPDWCLSRQRAWGVPLTVLTCADCGEILKDPAVAERIVAAFSREGADAWFKYDAAALIGSEARCGACGSGSFSKENDILDVWFDSGVSHAAVLEERQELVSPADLYLEGSDQHRGWFQSSLLASIGTRGRPPYKGVLTHGFVVDGEGKKMSKSIGNVIAPQQVIKQYGAEILRLWVASEDYRDDIKISDDILRQLSDAYRKIRNTIRFILMNIADFRPERDRVAYADLEEIDRWILHQFELVKRKARKGYDDFEFHTVFHGLYQFCGVALSSLYSDIIKDRLYTTPAADMARRSAQTVLHEILEGILLLMAPVLSFTAAEAWEYLPEPVPANVFLGQFPPNRDNYLDPELDRKWSRLLAVRAEITKALELARQNKVIGHPLEAGVHVAAPPELADFLADKWELLQAVAIISRLEPAATAAAGAFHSEEMPGLAVMVQPAPGRKCERCWMRSKTVGESTGHPLLCERCSGVMDRLAARTAKD